MDEIWKPVVGYEGYYEVSNYGNVRSVSRVVYPRGRARTIPSTVLKQEIKSGPEKQHGGGYRRVVLVVNGKPVHKSVHRLVAEAFLPNEHTDSMQVNHKDGVKHHNDVGNLEWCTDHDNKMHASEMGLLNPNPPKGTKAVFAKLTDEQVTEARMKYASGVPLRELVAEYGVGKATMLNCVRGRTYCQDGKIGGQPKQEKPKGAQHFQAVLTESQVEMIRHRHSRGETQTALAKEYGVSLNTVWRCVHHKRY